MRACFQFGNAVISCSKAQSFMLDRFCRVFIAKQAAEGRKSRAATFEAEVACEAVFGSSARESSYCDDFFNFEIFLPPYLNLFVTKFCLFC